MIYGNMQITKFDIIYLLFANIQPLLKVTLKKYRQNRQYHLMTKL